MQTAAEVLRTVVSRQLQRRALTNVKGTDESLQQLRGDGRDQRFGDNVMVAASYGLAKAMACSKGLPLYKCKWTVDKRHILA